MDSTEEAVSVIFIGMVIAEFLHKTGRVLQAIEVYKECLIILHSQPQAIDRLQKYRKIPQGTPHMPRLS
ncbi:hypothetical protein pdam_00023913 [Pocillopora damicornis]|uniref:Uncharacterized protein n=1 Tax=Pocillopora damicornis TaxID=46731 RepID=A0A3M6TZM3_POCDA|nr:hypothetical protein pdam_00023913 [Pocillopora damicornis]